VEYYDPTLDTWTPVAKITVCGERVNVGVLDGLVYAIGGYNGESVLKVLRFIDQVMEFDLLLLIWSYADFVLVTITILFLG